MSSLPPASSTERTAHKQLRHGAPVAKGRSIASPARTVTKTNDSAAKSAPKYELKPALVFPASAPQQLVDVYYAICECDLGPSPETTIAFLKIVDPREIASVIELLGMDTEYMPKVWAKLASLKVIEPVSLDPETERLLDLLEGDHVDRKSMPASDLVLCALVAKCAKMQSSLRGPNPFPHPKVWQKLARITREMAKLIHDNALVEKLFELSRDDSQNANHRPIEYRFLTIAQTADIMLRPGSRRIGKVRQVGIIQLAPNLSEFFRSHFARPLDREVADIASVVSGEVIDSDRVKMRRTRREHDTTKKSASGNKSKKN